MHLSDNYPLPAESRKARARALGALAELIDALNGPQGCPWDREQTPADLVPYLLDECRELEEALAEGDPQHAAEEWGDIAFLVLFFAVTAERAGLFRMPDALEATLHKMVRRHPHVFASVDVDGAAGVVRRWAEIKAQERVARDDAGVLGAVPPHVSALRKAHALQAQAATVGFDWPDITGVWEKVAEEMAELEEARDAGDTDAIAHELGDLQFALVSLQRHLGFAPEEPLNRAANRFTTRFRVVERLAGERGLDLTAASLEELDALWDIAKAEEAHAPESR